jgi:hypothetical protein
LQSAATGCLRASKESIFTGLNNLKMLSFADVHYSRHSEFTEGDVEKESSPPSRTGAMDIFLEKPGSIARGVC